MWPLIVGTNRSQRCPTAAGLWYDAGRTLRCSDTVDLAAYLNDTGYRPRVGDTKPPLFELAIRRLRGEFDSISFEHHSDKLVLSNPPCLSPRAGDASRACGYGSRWSLLPSNGDARAGLAARRPAEMSGVRRQDATWLAAAAPPLQLLFMAEHRAAGARLHGGPPFPAGRMQSTDKKGHTEEDAVAELRHAADPIQVLRSLL